MTLFSTKMIKLLRFGLLAAALLLEGCAEIDNLSYDYIRKPSGKVAILIDLSDQHAYLYSAGEVVLTAPVSTGREGYNTPAGRYRVIEKDLNHRSSIYGAYEQNGQIVMENVDLRKDRCPRGARFVGAPMPYFLRIVGGIGLHAGYLPGYPASHGCIRMPGSKAERFYAAARVGTPVTITR
jgi:lipoprotein-anchoring transpeptidase ErfK/SrfK